MGSRLPGECEAQPLAQPLPQCWAKSRSLQMASVYYLGEEGEQGGSWRCFYVRLTIPLECHPGK